jgi:hypothetical protein
MVVRSAILFILLCRGLNAQEAAGIEGVAIDSVTRQPMVGVHITMRSDVAFGAISGQNGHFSITGMPPALYVLTAQRNGYIHLSGKIGMRREDENVTLKFGQRLTDFIVEMTPRAAIAGRVLDEFGDPVQRVEVEAVPAASGFQAERFGMNDMTDERGQFRMTGPPGRFYVKATVPQRGYAQPEIRSDGLAPPVYGTTFYPSSGSKDQATAVEVAAGRDLAGIDIHLSRKLSLTISGVVPGLPDASAPAVIRIDGEGPDGVIGRLRFAFSGADGKFTVPGLMPGRYWLLAGGSSGDNLQSSVVEVRLGGADETGVSLQLKRGEALSGVLEMPGDRTEKPVVRLQPLSPFDQLQEGDSKGSEVDRDGAFRIEPVFPGKFRVRVLPMPENAYIKSVKLDSAEAPDGVLDLSRGVGGAKVKVSISLNGGQVEGTVSGDEGQPLESPLPLVVLAATVDEINGGSLKLANVGAKFKYTGLRPGKYRLIGVDSRQYDGDIDAVKAIFPKAPEIEIREGDRIVKDLKVTVVGEPIAKP